MIIYVQQPLSENNTDNADKQKNIVYHQVWNPGAKEFPRVQKVEKASEIKDDDYHHYSLS